MKIQLRTPIPGPRSQEVVAREQRHLAPGLQGFALWAGVAMDRGEYGRATELYEASLRLRRELGDSRGVASVLIIVAAQTLLHELTPTDTHGASIAGLGALDNEYSETVPNWTPYYYWVQAFGSNGEKRGTSTKVAAFAHPADNASARVETFAFWYEPYKPSTDPNPSRRARMLCSTRIDSNRLNGSSNV